MMLPRVILHNSVSVDGRVDWFAPDIGLHYELASRWKVDVHLAGSKTILSADEDVPPEEETAFEPPQVEPDDTRPLLVIPDSRGRVRTWHTLRQAPHWRGCVALCSRATPGEYREYLHERHIEYIVTGDDHVDLRDALEELSARYGAETVLVDSGGTLNGVLLRAGLVDEISLLVHPYLVGGRTPGSFFRAPDLNSVEQVIQLRMTHLEQVKDDIVWLRYTVSKRSRR
jgi:2,5-diamino-6-(ribosylamino)-4(3H)-pyrimidinone 5'-phosphate reductase